MQSYYTATVVSQIIEDRVASAQPDPPVPPSSPSLRARRAALMLPMTAASGRLRVSGAGR